jgi:phenylpropionate dioxygenase-like ring-hydroxylating dioxygenase large terminal subunit
MNKQRLQQLMSFLFTLSLVLASNVMTFGETSGNERLTLSGNVSRIVERNGKSIGSVTFNGTNQQGARYRGSGKIEITFDSTKKVVRRMKITFRGTKNSQTVRGTFSTNQRITFANPVTAGFSFSQVAGSVEGNDI